jgi:pyridoxal 5'-phosphate synthase pdxT subunit
VRPLNPTATSATPLVSRHSEPRPSLVAALSVASPDARPLTVGLLALQGDFDLHRQTVQDLGHNASEVRTVEDLADVDCLIMPGGESTTMRKLMVLGGLFDAIPRFAIDHPIMATCAGLILLSKGIQWSPEEATLGLIDCTVARNAYGRQFDSFRQGGSIGLPEGESDFEMVFIRAPKITNVGSGVEILGRLGNEPTLIRQGNILAMTFHPELAGDGRIHQFFLSRMAPPS